MKADQIETIVSQLLELKKTHTISQIDLIDEFKEFRENNKIFYQVILSDDMNMEIFKKMMKCKRELENGKDQYSVDVKFGQYMADTYIEPVIKK